MENLKTSEAKEETTGTPDDLSTREPLPDAEFGRAITGSALQDRLGPEFVAEIHRISREVFADFWIPNQTASDPAVQDSGHSADSELLP
jgi:hypothetical protein